ncbi:hypothetical protein HOD96_00335 [Candidatus Falkowbacteria bacterium]|jgi:hypothetical protein|nr:hypothetical protein [Candidatus Falkowbacteria bacterium]MBT4432859.1 hypothetical protein [Candidatus Falkowbacteria bacterium]
MYKKLKALSLKIDNKIKAILLMENSLIQKDKEAEDVKGTDVGEVEIKKHLKPGRIVVSRLNFNGARIFYLRLKVSYFGFFSFAVDIVLSITEQIIAIFGDPAIAFNLLYNQHQEISCPIPYSQFKKAQHHAKVFSYAGLATMVLMLSFSTMITNFLMGPTEKMMAASYGLVQESWTELSSAIAQHSNGDDSGWFKYLAKTDMEAGENLTVATIPANWNETTDADFNSYTSKSSNLSITSNSITLLKPNGAACSADSQCVDGYVCCAGNCETETTLSWPGSTHSNCDCLDRGGSVFTIPSGQVNAGTKICKITGTNLTGAPSGWAKARNWQQYTGTYYEADACGKNGIQSSPTSFSDAQGLRYYNNGGCSSQRWACSHMYFNPPYNKWAGASNYDQKHSCNRGSETNPNLYRSALGIY